jgi:RHS repeat-associated protein
VRIKIGQSICWISVWDGWELIEEYASSTSRAAAYLQGAHGVIKSLLTNVHYYQDKLGSTTHVANASGQLLESYRYDLYGTPSYFNESTQPSQPINSSTVGITDLYAGERWIPELGLYDLRNRFMSPELGRFLQPDPTGFKGDANNLYRYCHNDPEDFSDPTGLVAWSTLTSAGRGDWVVLGSDGLSKWDRDHGMGMNKPQAGMGDNAGGGGSARFTGRIHWKKTGNWKDKTLKTHLTSEKRYGKNGARLAGWTDGPGFKSYAQTDKNGIETGDITAEVEVNWWIAKALSGEDQKKVMEKELDYPNDWEDFQKYRESDTFWQMHSLIGSPVSEAATHLQSIVNPQMNAEFTRQLKAYDLSGKHNVPVKFLDETH